MYFAKGVVKKHFFLNPKNAITKNVAHARTRGESLTNAQKL